jgi:hypothetical protein
MEESPEVRDAVLDFYKGVAAKAMERFHDIVSAEPATLVIGTAPGECVTERPRLRFGFEAEGLTLEPGPHPAGYREGAWAGSSTSPTTASRVAVACGRD